uniref:Fe2OG dioxygenase domain-containing protein n=1 Tax=Kalanchoe fedtschenkoi TaxID=63787 RepID=A0A7N0RBQ8_KALFE
MGSESPLKLPQIDFSKADLQPGTASWDCVRVQVMEALGKYGCFEAFYDIPLQLRKAIFDSLEQLFDLPLQTKMRNSSKKPYHGYVGQYPQVPLFESMGIDGANIMEKTKSLTEVLWPEGNPSFCNSVQPFAQRVAELDIMVRRMVLECLGLEKYFEEHEGSTNYLLRVMKYKGPQTSDAKLGLNAHTDKNIVTILYQNQVDGLEVLTKDGEWIGVKPSEGSFIVMVGDSFHAWTNGRVYSAFHRVMMTGNEARYSAGLFSIPKAGYTIRAPEELVDDQHPQLYKPFDHVAFLGYYYTPAGQQDQFALKTYCGVPE